MKINEVIVEAGFLKNLGAAVKGVGQGMTDFVAPGAYDELQKSFRTAKVAGQKQKGASKAGNVVYNGQEYQWLGQQWGLVNPATGKTVPAPRDIQQQLNFMATNKMPDFSSMPDTELAKYAKMTNVGGAYGKALAGEIQKRKTSTAQQSQVGAGGQPGVQQDPLLSQIIQQSKSPLTYQFGKGNLFTLNDRDQWVRYSPGSTKPQQPVDTNTAHLLDKAAIRDKVDLARLQPQQTPVQTQTPDISTLSQDELLQLQQMLQGSAQ